MKTETAEVSYTPCPDLLLVFVAQANQSKKPHFLIWLHLVQKLVQSHRPYKFFDVANAYKASEESNSNLTEYFNSVFKILKLNFLPSPSFLLNRNIPKHIHKHILNSFGSKFI